MSQILKCLNPANGELIKELKVTSKEEIELMVQKSHKAQASWGAKTVKERAEIIAKAYDVLLEHKQEMADLIHLEMGKTPEESLREVEVYAGKIRSMGQEVDEALTPTVNATAAATTTTYYDPIGVCASVTPWNFPLGMPHTLMMPSLMAGNTVLFKPSEEVTLIGLKYAEFLNSVLPQDVLQVVVGAGEQGAALVESNVQLITFTGSQATGKRILQTAGKDLKRVLLELGGKDPLIVLEDADLEAAAKFAAMNSFRNTGQVCVSTESIYVLKSQEQEFIKLLKQYTADVKIGSMIHPKQEAHVVGQVKDALKNGAKLEFGDPEASRIEPLILSGLKADMDIMVNETFGPVACVVGVESIDEAVKLSNGVNYALGAVVFSSDTKAAHAVARKLKAGMVGINKACGGVAGSPWVGAEQSGYGYHGSANGHRQFAQVRIVTEQH